MDFQWVDWKYIHTKHEVASRFRTTIISKNEIFLNIGGGKNDKKEIANVKKGAWRERLWKKDEAFICDLVVDTPAKGLEIIPQMSIVIKPSKRADMQESSKRADMQELEQYLTKHTRTTASAASVTGPMSAPSATGPMSATRATGPMSATSTIATSAPGAVGIINAQRAWLDTLMHESVAEINRFGQKSIMQSILYDPVIAAISLFLEVCFAVDPDRFKLLVRGVYGCFIVAIVRQYCLDPLAKKIYQLIWHESPGMQLVLGAWARDKFDQYQFLKRQEEEEEYRARPQGGKTSVVAVAMSVVWNGDRDMVDRGIGTRRRDGQTWKQWMTSNLSTKCAIAAVVIALGMQRFALQGRAWESLGTFFGHQ